MPRAKTTKLYRNFVKGLITEASELTYPENASIDELNTIIERKGNRVRRLGFEYENSHSRRNIEANGWTAADGEIQEFLWKSPAYDSTKEFLCVQNGYIVNFYDTSVQPISGASKAFSINLSSYAAPSRLASEVAATPVEMTSGKGYLFIVSEVIEPLLVEYFPATDSITTTRILIQTRDFEGLYDGLANDEEPSTLTIEHDYNLHNQGWVGASTSAAQGLNRVWVPMLGSYNNYTSRGSVGSGPISDFYSQFSRYPGNNKQWWAAKATADDSTAGVVQGQFLPKVLDKLFSGNNHAPKGHYIVDSFYVDRSAVSGIPGIPIIATKERPSSSCFFSGRAWYACNSTVYFSQVLDQKQKAGNCYQEADPTSEDISDLIATDGGSIPIPEAIKIIKIIPRGSGVLVFSIAGVWLISGNNAGFTAQDITVSKVSPIGCQSPRTVVETESACFYWSDVGIMGMSQASGAFGPIEGKFDKNNISESTIQSFYVDIPQTARRNAKSVFDPASNIIYWIYNNDAVQATKQAYNRVLCFDVSLQAFYPWEISKKNSAEGPYISGAFTLISETGRDRGLRPSSTIFLTLDKVSSLWGISFAQPDNLSFTDWESFDGAGYTYESFLETGYELLEDVSRKKQSTYISIAFSRTENLFVDDGSGNYTSDRPSSCIFRAKWDWADKAGANKWSREVEAYRPAREQFVDAADLNDNYGQAVVVSKNKVRGSGRALQMRFSCSEAGKDFNLLGWSTAFTGNTDV